MSGKSYTMKEMKSIVDYLVEHSAYKEFRGRRMWMDFSNSQVTTRTWQSLKETFLKRILPDIHNPYYKLSMDQIRSFKSGYDVQAREKNKLEIKRTSEDSSCNAETQKQSEDPSTSKNIEQNKTSGEDIKCSTISHTRASVETVIIDNCYEGAEDIRRVLESSSADETPAANSPKPSSKSVKNLITYSEPLAPILQKVLDDFASDDDSDRSPKMQIVENVSDIHSDNEIKEVKGKKGTQSGEEGKLEYDIISSEPEEKDIKKSNEIETLVPAKIKSLKLRKRQAQRTRTQGSSAQSPNKTLQSTHNALSTSHNVLTEAVASVLDNLSKNVEKTDKLKKENSDVPTQTSLISMDSLLPSNQEALNKNSQVKEKRNSSLTVKKSDKNVLSNPTRKRAISQDVESKSTLKQKNLSVDATHSLVSMSDTDLILNKSKNLSSKNNSKPESTNDILPTTQKEGTDKTFKIPEIIVKDVGTNNEAVVHSESSQLNPCLKSVSLYAEQFNTTNYIDSESSEHEEANNSEQKAPCTSEKMTIGIVNEVVMLKSHSESESEVEEVPNKKTTSANKGSKIKRSSVLANVFGFTSGAVTKNRNRSISRCKSSKHRMRCSSSSESSEWISEDSDSDYVSPPRGRRSKHSRRYLKQHSGRILSLEQEGGLFVIYRNKIYPIVKDGKTLKNLTYLPESDPEHDENYWKTKYVEERQRVDELKTLINQRKPSPSVSPVLQSPKSPRLSHHCNESKRSSRISLNKSALEPVIPVQADTSAPKDKTLKITFAKNNQEVHLEGHWTQLHPVLADVVQLFQKEADVPPKEPTRTNQVAKIEKTRSTISISSSTVDEEVHEKVSKLENDIFKEIEEQAHEEKAPLEQQTKSNSAKRKRASNVGKISMSTQTSSCQVSSPGSPHSPKRFKAIDKSPSVDQDREASGTKINEETVQPADINVTSRKPKKDIKAKNGDLPSKKKRIQDEELNENNSLKEATSVSSDITVQSKRPKRNIVKKGPKETISTTSSEKRKLIKSKVLATESEENNNLDGSEDPEVRYMLPPATRASRKSVANASKTETAKWYSLTIPKIYSSPELSIHSESTQGYFESDVSPPKVGTFRRKRKLSLSTVLHKNRNRRRMRRRSLPMITNDISSDSNASFHIFVKPNNDSSLRSEVYKSESYQLLMANKRRSFSPLDKIDENSPIPKTYYSTNVKTLDMQREVNLDTLLISSQVNTEVPNSSNVSLPQSPELSIVENLSVSKDLLSGSVIHPSLNEVQANDTSGNVIENKYSISAVDVSMPLMQQECAIHISTNDNIDIDMSQLSKTSVSKSFFIKDSTESLQDAPSLCDSLDHRLRNLLLESARKMSIDKDFNDIQVNKKVKKTRNSKRCSTPRKRKEVKNTKLPTVDPVIEEEFVESCSYGVRKSCPPAFHTVIVDENNEEIIDKDSQATGNSKGRIKKDVIKVKILRPRNKSQFKEKSLKKNLSRMSIHTDSGINETKSILSVPVFNDSVDLIHNHSETCLHAHECVGDSVEFVDANTKSIISISDSESGDCISQCQMVFKDCEELAPEMFCNNARDYSNVVPGFEADNLSKENIENPSDTAYHSPIISEMSLTSLITEDLSDENPSTESQPTTKWYLLSEDETTNANPKFGQASNCNSSNFSSLRQLFPITCAVPDLSTISEMSKENDENSRKTILDSQNCDNTRNDLDSQSIF